MVLLWESLSNFTPVATEVESQRPVAREAREVTSLQRPNRRLDAEEVGALVSAYEAGGSVKGLAREFGVHHTTVRRLLDRAGVVRRKVVPLTEAELSSAVRLYDEGLTIAQVGDRFGRKYQTMRRELLGAGVVMRRPLG